MRAKNWKSYTPNTSGFGFLVFRHAFFCQDRYFDFFLSCPKPYPTVPPFSSSSSFLPEKAVAAHSSVLAWRFPGTGAWWARTESDATEAAQQQQLPFFSPSPFPQKGHNPHFLPFSSLCSSVRLLSCVLALCDPMDCSLPGFPVHHQLLEFAQTHVLRVSDAIQPSHPHSSPSPAFSLCQHQGLFQ